MSSVAVPSGSAVVPMPKGHFLLGNLPALRHDMLTTMEQFWREHGDLYRLNIVAPIPLYVVSHPDLAQEVLVHQKDKFGKMYRPDGKPVGLQFILGNGLLTNTNEESWLSQRRMMQPMFHKKRIALMGSKMVAAGERMLQRWAALPPDSQLELHHEMMKVTMDIITRTMFSADVMQETEKIGNAITVAVNFVGSRIQSPLRPPLSIPTWNNLRFKRALRDLDSLLYGLIRERRASGEQYEDLLDMLLAARDEDTGEGMTDEQIRDEVATIFGAGHETTANALTWTWYLLTQNPAVLNRLQAEVDTVLQGHLPTLDDLPNLPYTNMVLQEALRVYPPAPLIPRMVRETTYLNGYTIPKGSLVAVNVNHLHQHPDFWEHPAEFRPERFAPDAEKQRHRLAYMPFGAGARMCIGNQFALMEGALLLALMAQHYTLCLVEGQQVIRLQAVTLRPKYGIRMILQRR